MVKLWEKTVTLEAFQKKNTLPETPGAYFFLDAEKNLLYIGKATSLCDRVKSYFSRDIALSRGPKITRMLEQARFIAYRQTDSVLEALILESALIKKHQPPYNTDAKDDKSYNHVVITQEKFPRVLIVRGRDIANKQQTTNNKQQQEYQYVFGPFPHGMQLREAMKIVRRLFPFRDRCVPVHGEQLTASRKKALRQVQDMAVQARPCFNRQLGLCPGVCTGEITPQEYAKTIRNIRLFFMGQKSAIMRQLEREMKMAAKRLLFERAHEIKKTLFGLKHIQDMALIKNEAGIPARPFGGKNQELWKGRIEAYDVAHLGGTASVGVMTVVANGEAAKDAYRMFRLRKKHGGNDLSALEEVLTRRLKHPEWGMPDIVAVDGAVLQLGVAEKSFAGVRDMRPLIVGVVKDERHRPKHILNLPEGFANIRKDILLANSEAHRFAITFHRRRRGKEFLSTRA